MNPQRYAQIKEIFLAACDLPVDERNAYLEKACRDDPDLRARVDELLAVPADASLPDGVIHAPESNRTFVPGTVIGRRYRIIDRLGQGGMGEVYRAEDLRVGQTVALKFLLSEFGSLSRWRTRLCHEVRVARQITHRNVCRIFDVGEAHGRPFISMEYVAGEDLGSLLRRIGRVPPEKALEIALQICAGLAAAHAQGVLHRDLKPANVMLDDRGQVKITDFGLAGGIGEIKGADIRSGTPAYMAPEQRAGTEVTVRSDIYTLGLVLYELFTGRPAVPPPRSELSPQTDQAARPIPPSQQTPDIDPQIEEVIQQCLEPEPACRPATVLDVAAALPGSSLMTAALAAGQIPSPAMVAAADQTPGVSARWGFAGLAAVAVMLVGVILLSPLAHPLTRAAQMKSPEVLTDRAREMLRQLLPDLNPTDEAHGFIEDLPEDSAPDPPAVAGDSIGFWYRASDRPMIPSDPWNVVFGNGQVMPEDPSPTQPGTATLVLNGKGQLRRMENPPESPPPGVPPADPPTWSAWFSFAGLDPDDFQPAPPRLAPRTWFDQRTAWTEKGPESGIRVEAATYGGRPVFFAVTGNGHPPGSSSWFESPFLRRQTMSAVRQILLATCLLVSLPLAWANVLRGHSHLRGAFRLAAFIFAVRMAIWLLQTHTVPGFSMQLRQAALGAVGALTVAGMVYLFYLAMEPYVRRFWPHAIISCTRLMVGRGWDSQTGRDILLGTLLGVFWALLFRLDRWTTLSLGLTAREPIRRVDFFSNLLSPGRDVAGILDALCSAIYQGVFFLLIVALLRALSRRPRLAPVIAFALVAPLYVPAGSHPAVSWIVLGVGGIGLGLWVLTRFGLLAVVTGLFLTQVLNRSPLTLDFGAWYADLSGLGLLTTVGLALLGFVSSQRRTSRPATL